MRCRRWRRSVSSHSEALGKAFCSVPARSMEDARLAAEDFERGGGRHPPVFALAAARCDHTFVFVFRVSGFVAEVRVVAEEMSRNAVLSGSCGGLALWAGAPR
mmetsp:Transcript_7010/g.19372  ORF Transcript_7010/g.19372 Transcript_7010/m.19372 type:complete len:103 (+) Transcript_7010:125-433(+)